MVTFQAKKIASEPSVGETLANRRQEKRISLAKASAETKVSIHYLTALETSNYYQFPGEVYAKNFLKVYAKFLDLAANELLEKYLSEQKIYHKTKKVDNTVDQKKPVARIFWFNLLVTPKIIRNGIIIILVVICLAYLGLKMRAIVSPPFLEVTQPINNTVINKKVIEVIGQSEKETILKINGQPVLADEQGNFTEILILHEGSNIIEVSAQKKRSKPVLIYRKVIVVEGGS